MKNKNFTFYLFLLIIWLSGLLPLPVLAQTECRELINRVSVSVKIPADANSSVPTKSVNLGLAEKNYTCFLAGIAFNEIDDQGEHASCEVSIDSVSNQWVLEAKVTEGDNDNFDTDANCEALCFKWEIK